MATHIAGMRAFGQAITLSWLLLAAVPCAGDAQAKTSDVPESVPRFVRSFYDWYVPLVLGDTTGSGSDLVLKYRASALADALVRALKTDSEAQARAPAEIVGLDFDPFLNSQDPCERYEVGRATRKGESYRVDIHGVCAGTRHEKPDVVAEVVQRNGSWLFVNIHYPSNRSDLLRVLRGLRDERRKAPRPSHPTNR